MGAAARCEPRLPDDVLCRASELILLADKSTPDESSGTSSDYVRALSKSLERQVALAEEEITEAKSEANRIARLQRAMLTLAEAYERRFGLLEYRLETCYRELRESSTSAFEVIGDSLGEVRIAKKDVLSVQELLKQRGLKVVSDSYDLSEGETVVVIAEGEWNGVSCQVVSPDSSPLELKPDEVLVLPSTDPCGETAISTLEFYTGSLLRDESTSNSSLVFKRYQLAIWDYDSVWEEDVDEARQSQVRRVTSVPDSKRRLYDVLSSLKTSSPASSPADGNTSKKAAKNKPSAPFKPARERSAAKKNSEKRKRRKR